MTVLLLAATFISIISSIIPTLIKPFLSCLFVETSVERNLRNVIGQLIQEKADVSPVDEFAKYARLDRKLNKAVEELKSLANDRKTSNFKQRLIITNALRILVGIFTVILVWTYKSTPVIVLPSGWLYPFSSVISWPTGQEGAVSITSWLIVTRAVVEVAMSSLIKS